MIPEMVMVGTPAALTGVAEDMFEAHPAATLLFDDDLRLLGMNRAARVMLAQEHATTLAADGRDEAGCCLSVGGPEACSSQPPCQDCVIRRCVLRALTEGGVERAPGALRRSGAARGPELELLVSAAPLQLAGRTYALLTLDDARRGRGGEAEAGRQRRFTRSVIDSIGEAVLLIDELGRVTFANREAEEAFGFASSELEGRPVHDALHHPREDGRACSARDCPMHEAYTRGAAFRHRSEVFVRKDGSLVSVSCSSAPIELEGRRVGSVLVARDATALRRAEQAARLSDAQYRLLFENMLDGVARCRMLFDEKGDPSDFVYLDVNTAFGKLTGLADVIGRRMSELSPIAETTPERLETYARAALGGPPERLEARVEPLGLWLSMSVYGAEPDCFVMVFEDISDRKRAEAALRESEVRLRLFVENAPAALAMLDRDMRYLSVSRRWLTDYGLGDQELRGRSHYEVFPEIGEAWKRVHQRALAGDVVRCERERFVRADGRVTWLKWEVCPWPEVSGGVGGIVIFSHDITELARATEAVHRNAEWLRLAQEAAAAGTVEWDLATHESVWSDEVWKLYGLEKGRRAPGYEEWYEALIPEDRAVTERVVREAVGAGDELSVEFRVRRDGGIRHLLYRGRPLRDATGKPVRYLGIVFDITDRKRTEQALRASREQLRKLAARQEVVEEEEKRRIAHDLHDEMGQLLTALRFDVEALEDGLSVLPAEGSFAGLLDRAVDASELIAQTVEAMQRVVNTLRPAALDHLGLCPALRQECRRFQERTGIPCAVRVPDEPRAFGSEVNTALFRVAQEALTNVARHAGASAVAVEIELAGSELVLRVEDDGRGLDVDSIAPRSLGIAGMRERIERLGGELSVRQGERRGTVVHARIPLEHPASGQGVDERMRS